MPMSDDEVRNVLFGGQQQSSGVSDDQVRNVLFGNQEQQMNNEAIEVPVQEKSPLTWADRFRFAFSDQEGQEAELKSKFNFVEQLPNGKFLVGDNIKEMQPVDPEGIFNDMIGDVVDIAGAIPTIAGQIGGAMLGSAFGPAGTIIGGGTGAGLGETLRQNIGKSFGVVKASPEEQIQDRVISSLFGGAGEGAVVLAKSVGKNVIAPKILKVMDDKIKRMSQIIDPITGAPVDPLSSPYVNNLAKIFKFTASVDEKATLNAAKHGFLETFTPENLDERTILAITKDIRDAAKLGANKLGEVVRKERSDLIQKAKGADINVEDISARLMSDLDNAGLIDQKGNILLREKFKESDKAVFSKLLDILDKPKLVLDANGNVISSTTKSVKLPKAVQIEKIFEDSYDDLSDQGQAILRRALSGDKLEKVQGLRQRINAIAEKTNSTNYITANEKYSKFRGLLSRMKQIESKNPAITEHFIKNIEKQAVFTQDDYRLLQNQVPEIPFLNRLEKFNAAQAFKDANPNFLRFSSILGALGAAAPFGGDDIQSRALKGAAGLAIGSPAGVRFLLRSSSRLGKTSKNIMNKKNVLANANTQRLLTALISQSLATQNKPSFAGSKNSQ